MVLIVLFVDVSFFVDALFGFAGVLLLLCLVLLVIAFVCVLNDLLILWGRWGPRPRPPVVMDPTCGVGYACCCLLFELRACSSGLVGLALAPLAVAEHLVGLIFWGLFPEHHPTPGRAAPLRLAIVYDLLLK